MINFTRAFDNAWERMVIILFRPFDLGKWFAIGFCAFLAGLLRGGNGVNVSFGNPLNRRPDVHWHYTTTYSNGAMHFPAYWQNLVTTLTSLQFGISVLIIAVGGLFFLGLLVLIYWLGARGEFMLLDNITRNRGAVAEPWARYARPANRAFVFYLLYWLISFSAALLIVVPAVILAWPLFHHPHWPEGPMLVGLVVFGLLYLAVVLVFGFTLFLFHEWGVPLMFRNDLSAPRALGEIWRLAQVYPGSVILFLLLRVALFIALAILSYLACCFTCCIEMLPYLGTIVLLPAILYTRCFSLDCLAQFGPSYDVWTVDVPPITPAATNLPPPLG